MPRARMRPRNDGSGRGLCGFAGVRWGSAGCAAERHGGRSLHWAVYGFAGSAVGIGGVYCGTVITVPYTGMCGFALIRRLSVVHTAERHGGRSLHWVFADSPGCGGGWWRVAFPTLARSPVVANLNGQDNDPTYKVTTTAAPITVWVCILCRKTVQPKLHR